MKRNEFKNQEINQVYHAFYLLQDSLSSYYYIPFNNTKIHEMND